MNGTVKWFSTDKGFGFITDSGGIDYFFHVSNVNGVEVPNSGDSVEFTATEGKKGKPAATNIKIVSRKAHTKRPYYGKNIQRTEVVEHGSSKVGTATGLGVIGAIVGGPIGGIVGAVLGGVFGEDKEKVTKKVVITNPCIRCGGDGYVTSRIDGRTGFQCKTCGNFWKVPDHKLPRKDLEELEKVYPSK